MAGRPENFVGWRDKYTYCVDDWIEIRSTTGEVRYFNRGCVFIDFEQSFLDMYDHFMKTGEILIPSKEVRAPWTSM